ncbi:MAG TPA: hypothetical protein VF789_29600 [Thermoanaerobaculia bacterium]
MQLLDAKLTELSKEADQIEDPDMSGHYERMEYIIGFGFVACQQYLAAVMGTREKKRGLSLGPTHRLGDPIATIVNAAANYWKHLPDWDSLADKRAMNQREETRKPLLKLGVNLQCSYPLSCVLAELLSPPTACFEELLPLLVVWREAWLRERPSAEVRQGT